MGPGPEHDAAFNFVSSWDLPADRRKVWDALVDFRRWPDWWPGLRDVEPLRPGDPAGIGETATSHWQAPLGYHLEITIEAVERVLPDRLVGIASGDLEGFGSWELTAAADPPGAAAAGGSSDLAAAGDVTNVAGPHDSTGGRPAIRPDPENWTTVTFHWQVSPTRRWMIALVPIARPLFVKGHDHVMEGGAEGLAGYLGCEVRGFSSRSL